MDNKCEELLADSVINNRYPNKAKLNRLSGTYISFPQLSTPLWKTLSRLLWKNVEKFGAQKRH